MLHTVKTNGEIPSDYVPPLIGNGNLSVLLSEDGAQVEELSESTKKLCWTKPRIWIEGRRYEGPSKLLVPFGHWQVDVVGDGKLLKKQKKTGWEQTLNVQQGKVETLSRYGKVEEKTASFCALDRNLIVLHKQLAGIKKGKIIFRYLLHQQAGINKPPQIMDFWSKKIKNGVQIHFVVEGSQMYEKIEGYIIFLTDRPAKVKIKGNIFELEVGLNPNNIEARGYLYFVDNLNGDFRQLARDFVPWLNKTGYQKLVKKQEKDWGKFWANCYIRVPEKVKEIQEVWETALYGLRCFSTDWSVPPGVFDTHWAGRFFHDELFPFYAFVSSNQTALAGKITRFRGNKQVLEYARQRTGSKGIRYAWESVENGLEAMETFFTSYYEIWQMASIGVCAWEYYRYTGDKKILKEICYPVIKGCAEFFRHWVMVDLDEKRIITVPCVDLDEGRFPITLALCTAAGAIRCLQLVVKASEVLEEDAENRPEWRRLADKLLANLPTEGQKYLVHPGAKHESLAVITPFFPFPVKEDDPLIKESALSYYQRCRGGLNFRPSTDPGNNWTWGSSWLAVVLARAGEKELAGQVMQLATKSTNTFGSVNESLSDKRDWCSQVWFTTGEGAYVHGVNELFLQCWDENIRIFPAVPEDWPEVSFKLGAPNLTAVEARMEEGMVREVKLTSAKQEEVEQTLLIPSRLILSPLKVEKGQANFHTEKDQFVIKVKYKGEAKLIF